MKCLPVDPSTWLHDLYGKMDVVVDSVCLDGKYTSSMMALKETGTLVCTGMSAPYTMQELKIGSFSAFLRDRNAGAVKFSTQHLSSRAVWLDTTKNQQVMKIECKRHFYYLCHQTIAGAIEPTIASRGGLKEVAATQRLIEGGKSKFGINICTPWNFKQNTGAIKPMVKPMVATGVSERKSSIPQRPMKGRKSKFSISLRAQWNSQKRW